MKGIILSGVKKYIYIHTCEDTVSDPGEQVNRLLGKIGLSLGSCCRQSPSCSPTWIEDFVLSKQVENKKTFRHVCCFCEFETSLICCGASLVCSLPRVQSQNLCRCVCSFGWTFDMVSHCHIFRTHSYGILLYYHIRSKDNIEVKYKIEKEICWEYNSDIGIYTATNSPMLKFPDIGIWEKSRSFSWAT